MKKLLMLFCIFSLAVTASYAQATNDDDVYYQGDQSSVVVQSPEPPPALPSYVQPPCPGDGYLWNPGYWAWAPTGYYWVPGVWVLPPAPDLLWTPGYWGFYGGYYGWHRGYWGAEIGYYGGVNYGFGYFGTGFYGGRWEGGHFRYNTAVWRVDNRVVHNTYVDRNGWHNDRAVHASYNGPRGGVHYKPAGHEEESVRATNHREVTPEQRTHEQTFGGEKGQFHSTNPRPAVHSMSAPGGQRFNQRGKPAGGGGQSHGSGGGGGKHR